MIITEETLRQLKSREPIQCETKAYTFEDIMKLPKEHITELLFVTFHRCEEMDEKIKHLENQIKIANSAKIIC